VDFNISLSGLDGLQKLARADIERATEKALDRTSQIVLNEKRRQVAKTYARPIPRGRNGRPKWRRSGDFQSNQTIESRTGERTIGPVGRSSKYEGRLAKLPVSKDGVNRRNPATEEAVRIVEPQIEPVFLNEIRTELGL